MGKRNVGNVIEIIKNDFRAARSNPIVTIVLIGLIILPSLYALLNIQACWDPYGNTGEVEFAIANLDKGATFEGEKINVGNELVKDLKENDKFKWTFVTEDELRDGVYKGDYYAGIVIPKNLSKNILSITGDNPKQAKLEYIVNMKANPVGAKLTDSGSNAVYNALNAKIIEIINLAAYGKLGELQEGLASGASQLASGGSQLAAGAAQVSSGADQVSSGADQVKDGSSAVKDGASKVQSGASDVNSGADAVKKGSSAVKDGASQVEQGSEELQSAVDPSMIPEGPVKEYVDGNVKLANGSGEVANGASKLADGSVALAEGSSKLANGSSQVAGGASQLADGSVQLAEGSLALAAGSQLLSNAATQALFTAAGSLGASADQLSAITGINETMLGDYFYAPVKLDRHELFEVPDYGSQVAPFYLVLSMWVGALITCAMLRPGTSTGTKYSPLEMYLGKSVLFVIMSLLQCCVTIIGAHILGIYIDNEIMFILSALIVSGVFMILVYSIVSALGDVGKAIAVVLLVFQISGTGGIYPVEIMDTIFNVLHPYLPMTYAITLIREAQLGLIWSNYLPALTILLGIGLSSVVLLVIIKEKADKATHYFENKLEESGLF
ncbi:MAG: YhgE/Pip domain-containing protein [Methanobrevibacter sp.]|uniref:YhgE/Pip domain-containing protein n=1 Tax=Methanobrevibacter sp. TaxID=66852 RepID=UPI001B678CB4|nr:YhgE/Pip domain-containing protein [Methanobrevibacter sp.]MBP3790558.1 YhgE/Pip domain-containing protein [Methanobrevibacter sp.]